MTSTDLKTKELRITGNVALQGGTWTVPEQPNFSEGDPAWDDGNGVYRLVARIGGTLTVGADASISVTGKGFQTSEGPGPGSHGGVACGDWGQSVNWDGHEFSASDAYGSIKQPVTIGSGSDAGAGGGGIELEVTGAATIAGLILADGIGSGHDDDSCSYCHGAGGGGIWIKAASLTGAGTISAAHGYVMFGGGGGRVAVYVTGDGRDFSEFAGRIEACGGFYAEDSVESRQGAAGSVYLHQADGTSQLVYDNGLAATYPCRAAVPEPTYIPTSSANEVFTNIVVRNSAWLSARVGSPIKVCGDFTGDGLQSEPMGEPRTIWSTDVGGIEFVDATRVSHISGSPVFRLFKCETPGKVIQFATDNDSVTRVGAGGFLKITGTQQNPVVLCSPTEWTAGKFVLADGGHTDVNYARIQDIDSTDGGTVLAHTTSILGSNVSNWLLADPSPGINTWQGGTAEGWGVAGNWSLGRPPIEGDAIVVNSGRVTLPCLIVFSGLTVGSGAYFNFNGKELGVSGDVSIEGTFDNLLIDGAVGPVAGIAMKSSEAGTAWKLKVTELADVRGVNLSDSAVQSGSVLVGDRTPSVDGGGNSGWIFGNPQPVTGVLASNYIQAGLVANFDAIENAGAGQHDVMPGEWINLAASGCDNIAVPIGQYTFNAKSLVVKKSRLIAENLLCAKQTTPIMLETYMRLNSAAGLSGPIPLLTLGPRARIGFDTRWEEVYTGFYLSRPTYANSANVYGYWKGRMLMDAVAYGYRTYSAGFLNGRADKNAYRDGAILRSGNSWEWDSSTVSDAYGSVYIGNNTTETEFGAVRVYSRELSAAEAAVNANVDQMRFKGADAAKLTWPAAFCWSEGRVRQRLTVECDSRYGTVTVNGSEPQSGRIEIPYDIGTTPSFTLVATPSANATGFFKWQGTGITASGNATLTVSPSTNITEIVALFRAEGVHYVPGDFATPSAALASANVQANDTVYLLDGTHKFAQVTDATTKYSCIAAIRDKPILLTGSSRDRVILDCDKKGGFVISNAYATVANVTIQNFMNSVAAPALQVDVGTVSNCFVNGSIVRCSKAYTVSAVWAGYGATITDSEIASIGPSTTWGTDCQCRVLSVNGGRIVRSFIRNNFTQNFIVDATMGNGKRPRFENCKFQWNSAPVSGIKGSNFDVIGCSFTEPSYFDHGAAGAAVSTGTSCSIVDSVFTGYKASGNNGVINCNGTVGITNCLVTRNAMTTYGALHVASGTRLSLVNTTVADNKSTSADHCGGISGGGGSSNHAKVTMINSILWNNTANGELKNFKDAYSYTDFAITNSCFTGMDSPAEANNTSDDPKFIDDGGMDYRLGDGSSCINAGLDVPEVTTDLDGKTRPIDGIGYGEMKWDIGCYEANGPDVELKATLSVAGEVGIAPCTVTQNVVVVGSRLTGLTYEWLAIHTSGGTLVTNRQETLVKENVFENLEPGVYTFVVIVRNNQSDTATDTAEDAFRALAGTTYASPSGSNQYPYSTPATAANSIRDAVQASGKRVVVLEGTYNETPAEDAGSGKDYVFVDRLGLTIEGTADPKDVVIDCGGGGGIRLETDSSFVHGVTFRNFMTTATSGAALWVEKGLASNIVCRGSGVNTTTAQPCLYGGHETLIEAAVVSNFCGSGNTSVRAVHLSGGTLRHSIVRGNHCTGAPVVGCYKSTGGRSSRVENCLLADNQGSSSATAVLNFSQSILINSTVTRNRSENKANVVLYNYGAVTIENCAISNNFGKSTVWVDVFWGSEGTTMRNSLVADNENGAFAAVALNDWSMRCWMENCTIANNRSAAGAVAAGVYGKSSTSSNYATLSLKNTIVWGNTVDGVANDFKTVTYEKTIMHSAFPEAATYKGANITNNLTNARMRKDCHLTGRSPAHDSGMVLPWHATGQDLDGKPRVRNSAVDMGCYEDPLGKGVMVILR